MANIAIILASSLLPLSLAWGAAAMTGGVKAGPVIDDLAELPVCELRAERTGRTVELEGLVHAGRAVSGSYRLRVVQNGGGGSSQINQGGEFDARAGSASSLGIVSLLAAPGSYTATLTVQWDDGSLDCVAKAPATIRRRL
jgi:hypothetical protein